MTPAWPCEGCAAGRSELGACASCAASAPLVDPRGSPFPAPGAVIQERYELGAARGLSLLGPWYEALDRIERRPLLLRALPGALLREELTLTRLVADVRQAIALPSGGGVTSPERVVLAEPYAFLAEPPPAPGSTSLAARLAAAGGRLALEEAAAVLERLLEVLRFAHLRQAVHGALSLADVWLLPDGALELRGFGQGSLLARLLSVDDPPFAPHAARDVYRGEIPAAATDLYAAASIGFTLLAGRPPFHGEGSLQRLKFELPPDLGKLRPEVKPPFAGALRKGLAKGSVERFKAAGDMIVALRVATRPPAAPGGAPARPSRPAPRPAPKR